jgi:hypothetical protein
MSQENVDTLTPRNGVQVFLFLGLIVHLGVDFAFSEDDSLSIDDGVFFFMSAKETHRWCSRPKFPDNLADRLQSSQIKLPADWPAQKLKKSNEKDENPDDSERSRRQAASSKKLTRELLQTENIRNRYQCDK